MSHRRIIITILAFALLGAAGCNRRAGVSLTPSRDEPGAGDVLPIAAPGKTAAPVANATPTVTPAPSPMKEKTEEEVRTPAQLQAAYLAATEISDKVQFIYDLGDLDTSDAIYTLMRLFETESNVDLKQEMIDATERMEEFLPAKLAFLSIALRPSQPADIRETAVGLLLTIDDRRAIPLWQTLLKDPDPDRVEQAKERIEDLQQLEPNSN